MRSNKWQCITVEIIWCFIGLKERTEFLKPWFFKIEIGISSSITKIISKSPWVWREFITIVVISLGNFFSAIILINYFFSCFNVGKKIVAVKCWFVWVLSGIDFVFLSTMFHLTKNRNGSYFQNYISSKEVNCYQCFKVFLWFCKLCQKLFM